MLISNDTRNKFSCFIAIALIFLCNPVNAQPVLNYLRDEIEPLAPNDVQYAVGWINPSANGLWPLPRPSGMENGAGIRNWYYARGEPFVGNHAEDRVMTSIVEESNYEGNFGNPINSIALYTRMTPCDNCSTNLIRYKRRNPQINIQLGFYVNYDNQTDTQNFNSLRNIQVENIWVFRVCGANTPCPTFQRELHNCLISKPIVCKFCSARALNIAQFINSSMLGGKTRNFNTWANSLPGPAASAAESAEVQQNINTCVQSSSSYPVEGIIHPEENNAGWGWGTPPVNWANVTGVQQIPVRRRGGPACGEPGMIECPK